MTRDLHYNTKKDEAQEKKKTCTEALLYKLICNVISSFFKKYFP